MEALRSSETNPPTNLHGVTTLKTAVDIFIAVRTSFLPQCYSTFFNGNKGKGKVIPLHAMEALGVRGGIDPTHS
jgi:hypothetical protein